MDIIAAYREAGTFRGAAEIAGTTHKTVKRVIERHEAGGGVPLRAPRGCNYDGVAVPVAERVEKTSGRISAKRLLPAARAAGYGGSDRNFRRLVAEQKALWRRDHHRGSARRCGRRVSIWSSTGVPWLGCTCSARCWPGPGSGSCGSPPMSGPPRRWACGATWPRRGGSSPGRYARAPSRPRSPPAARHRRPSVPPTFPVPITAIFMPVPTGLRCQP
jgi:hypothetical protein